MFMLYPLYLLSTSASVIDFLYFLKWPPAFHTELAQTGKWQFQIEIKHVMPLNKIFTAVMHYDGENVYICFFYNGFRQCDPQMSAKKQWQQATYCLSLEKTQAFDKGKKNSDYAQKLMNESIFFNQTITEYQNSAVAWFINMLLLIMYTLIHFYSVIVN